MKSFRDVGTSFRDKFSGQSGQVHKVNNQSLISMEDRWFKPWPAKSQLFVMDARFYYWTGHFLN